MLQGLLFFFKMSAIDILWVVVLFFVVGFLVCFFIILYTVVKNLPTIAKITTNSMMYETQQQAIDFYQRSLQAGTHVLLTTSQNVGNILQQPIQIPQPQPPPIPYSAPTLALNVGQDTGRTDGRTAGTAQIEADKPEIHKPPKLLYPKEYNGKFSQNVEYLIYRDGDNIAKALIPYKEDKELQPFSPDIGLYAGACKRPKCIDRFITKNKERQFCSDNCRKRGNENK